MIVRVARCPVFNETVRYFGSLLGIKTDSNMPAMHVSDIALFLNNNLNPHD